MLLKGKRENSLHAMDDLVPQLDDYCEAPRPPRQDGAGAPGLPEKEIML
jgi:hypothetical protein